MPGSHGAGTVTAGEISRHTDESSGMWEMR
jgi:hypothetical protein